MDQLPRERLIVAVGSQAHAEFMFEETRNYVRQRKAFGKTLSNIQVGMLVYSGSGVYRDASTNTDGAIAPSVLVDASVKTSITIFNQVG